MEKNFEKETIKKFGEIFNDVKKNGCRSLYFNELPSAIDTPFGFINFNLPSPTNTQSGWVEFKDDEYMECMLRWLYNEFNTTFIYNCADKTVTKLHCTLNELIFKSSDELIAMISNDNTHPIDYFVLKTKN